MKAITYCIESYNLLIANFIMLIRNTRSAENIQLKKPYLPTLLLIIIIIISTIGYDILWADYDSTILDELYMTFITISTIGYAEIFPLDPVGRVFTIIVAMLGIGSLFYILSIMMENLFAMQFLNIRSKKRMTKKIKKLRDHVILVGYGRVGKLAANELAAKKIEFVLIDERFRKPDDIKDNPDILAVEGDATNDEVLQYAGISRAKSMIIATANSATTVFIILSAKVLNPGLFVVARADEDSAISKMKMAGADRIVNPYSIGGQRLANIVIDPYMVEFFEKGFSSGEESLVMEKIIIPPNSRWVNNTLGGLDLRKKSGVSILVVIRDNKPNLNPHGDFVIHEGDQLVAIGTQEQISAIVGVMMEVE